MEVLVWVGLGASRQERKSALNMAAMYLKNSGLPADTPISSCLEGAENEVRRALGLACVGCPVSPRAGGRAMDEYEGFLFLPCLQVISMLTRLSLFN